jgi:hypothetical protein
MALMGAVIVLVLALPPVREVLEAQMALHMLVQIPLLALSGGVAVRALPTTWRDYIARWNRLGMTGTIMALLVSSWWMVPRALDGALSSGAMELAKFVSLPLLVGAPIALSWSELPFIGKGFVLANVMPMWAVVGWLYVVAPARLCNYYLLDQQAIAGYGLILTSVLASIVAASLALSDTRRHGHAPA